MSIFAKRMSLAAAVLWLTGAGVCAAAAAAATGRAEGPTVRFTVLYDNYVNQEGTRADWGFSCLIEGTDKTILFDTGTNPEILMHNVEILKVDLKKIDLVVISHEHGDHIGGLPAVLKANPNVTVFFPASFSPEFGRRVLESGAKARTIVEPVEICPRVHVTGEMGDRVNEQSLVLDTPRGLVIVTGCSHQGIVNVLERAKEILDRPIHLVFGGFHLGGTPDAEVETIIASFKEMKVGQCGATHCTGDKPIALFKAAFGDRYVPIGTGKVIELPGY